MGALAIFELVTKGLGIISTAIAVGKNAIPAIEAVKNLVTAAKMDSVTPELLAATEASLDAMIDDFNTPIV